jgi:riboflavin kinase/FMN adenylyltransferase
VDPSLSGPTGGPASLPPRTVATVGKFDGVHAGHRHLVAHLLGEADRRGTRSVAVVLHPDPATVLAGQRVPLLTTVAERARRLRDFGVDQVWHLPFDLALAEISAEDFVGLLAAELDLAALVVGADFAFGRGRTGTVALLGELARSRGFDLVVVPPLGGPGGKLGSRSLRARVMAGEVAGAREGLRAPPWLEGTVVAGAQRGRTLGFPTANLAPAADFAIPADGIYTVQARWSGPAAGATGAADGLASIGVRPTFDHGDRVVEVYLLDFRGDLYGARLAVDFLQRLRGEERFDSVAALVTQMHRDEAAARAYLAEAALPAWELNAAGRELVARGFDVAALATRLAAGLSTDDGSGGRTGGRAPLALAAPAAGGTADLVARWLAALQGPDLAPVTAAEVYQAGAGWIHALVARMDGAPPGPSRRPAGPPTVRRLPQGHLEARLPLV